MSNRELHTELTSLCIMNLYDLMHPINYALKDCADLTWEFMQDRQKAGIERYQNDSLFYTRVQSMVSSTMFLINKYTDNKRVDQTGASEAKLPE